MKLINLAMFSILVISVFLISCSTKNPSILPVSESETSKPVARTSSRDTTQSEWEKTLSGAKKEGSVVVYAAYGLAQAREPLRKAFSEKFGIALEMTIAQGPELSTKLITERRAGLYLADVNLNGAESLLNDIIPRNMVEPIEPYLILPEIKDPSAWFGGNVPFWEKQRVSLAPLANIPNSKIAINNSLRPDDFISYKELLRPNLKGFIVMADPTNAGSGSSWFALALKLMGEDYIKELVKQDVVLTRDYRLITEWLIRGKSTLGIGVDTAGVRASIKDGAPLSFLGLFKEGADIGPAGGIVAPMEKNPHPNAARVFINWFLSKEGQTILSKATSMASRRLDVPTDHLLPWMVPDPKVKYIVQDEDYIIWTAKMRDVAKELFVPLLK